MKGRLIVEGIFLGLGWVGVTLAGSVKIKSARVKAVRQTAARADSLSENKVGAGAFLKITSYSADYLMTMPDANRRGTTIVFLPFKPSSLDIRVFDVATGETLTATVAVTWLKMALTQEYALTIGPLELELDKADEVIVDVSQPGFEPVRKQFKVDVPPAGRKYELDVRLERIRPESTARSIDVQVISPGTVRPVEPLAQALPAVIATKSFGAIERGKNIPLSHLYFDQSSPILRPQSFTELDQLAQVLQENPGMRIQIRGYTDNVGDFDLNVKLAQGRCQSVVDYLVAKGIGRERLQSVGRGPLDPVAPNNTEENRRKNRRVEFVVL